jgi:hypothetical protein
VVTTILSVFIGLGTLHAQTLRPDDLTVLMAADAVHHGSAIPAIWARERLDGSNRGIPRLLSHGLPMSRDPEAMLYLRFFKAVGLAERFAYSASKGGDCDDLFRCT